MGRGKNHPHIADLVSLRWDITLFLTAHVPLGSKPILDIMGFRNSGLFYFRGKLP